MSILCEMVSGPHSASRGCPQADLAWTTKLNICFASTGILRIELGKEVFERTGLTGQPIRSGGRKHGKERFSTQRHPWMHPMSATELTLNAVVELNFRLPSMLHGKKGFERIVWAFKNVLNQSLAWLFCDLDAQSRQNEGSFSL